MIELESHITEPEDSIVDATRWDRITATLSNERAARSAEHSASGAIAYDLKVWLPECEGHVLRTTYTIGPGIDAADADRALWSLAMDALSARMVEAPNGRAGLDLDYPTTRRALDRFAAEYGHATVSGAIEAYRACVEANTAFEKAGIDPADIVEALED